VPESQRENLRQLITHVLGPTALEDPLADTGEEEGGGDEGGGDEEGGDPLGGAPLQLGQGSRLLDEGGAEPTPTLGEGEGDGNDLLHDGEPSKIHLGEPGEGLHLDFNH
jgi:hypothetical protein